MNRGVGKPEKEEGNWRVGGQARSSGPDGAMNMAMDSRSPSQKTGGRGTISR